MQIDGCTPGEIKSLQYLGNTVTEGGTSETEVKKRLVTATGAARKAEWTVEHQRYLHTH